MLLEAQKGPISLQEALRVQAGNHQSQQDELRGIIGNLRDALVDRPTPPKEEDRSGEDNTTGAPTPLLALIPQVCAASLLSLKWKPRRFFFISREKRNAMLPLSHSHVPVCLIDLVKCFSYLVLYST